MPLLRDDPDFLEAVATAVAEKSGIPLEQVEKDYWLTEALRGLAAYGESNHLPILLKGGTSLAKAFSLIKRFSEDADMVVIFGDQGKASRETHLKGFISAVEEVTTLSAVNDPSQADTGVTRVVHLDYASSASEATVLPRIKVELHTIGGSFPHAPRQLTSLIAEHWAEVDHAGEPDFEELAPFEIAVLDPCRTLVEKLVLLHEAHTRTDETAKHRRIVTVRPYYDVYCLIGNESVMDALAEHDVAHLARDVDTHSRDAEYDSARRPSGGFAESPAFAGNIITGVRDAYDKTVRELLWPGETYPTIDECRERVRSMARLL